MIAKACSQKKVLRGVHEDNVSNSKSCRTSDDDRQATDRPRKPSDKQILPFGKRKTDAKPQKGSHQRQIFEVGEDPDLRRQPSDDSQLEEQAHGTQDEELSARTIEYGLHSAVVDSVFSKQVGADPHLPTRKLKHLGKDRASFWFNCSK